MRDYFPQPRVKRSPQNLIVSYQIPQQAYTVKVYPILSSNGSSIILIGHENGVKVIWRGGRPFKTQEPTNTNSHKVNGAGTNVVSLDFDDESTPPIVTYSDQPQFVEDEEEFDPSHPYPGILQILDLSFETGALQLAVLPSSILESYKPLLGNRITFVGAYTDKSLRLVTLPLDPPSPASKSRSELCSSYESANFGNGKWGEKGSILNGHEKTSDGVSMTLDYNDGDPFYIIASISNELNGRLLLWCSSLARPELQVEPFHSICLASPARAIAFNTSPSRPNFLLVTEAKGVCRLFQYSLPHSQTNAVDALESIHGRWLLSLMTDFPTPKSKYLNSTMIHTGVCRKTIADAQWIFDGCAILVLLDDGEWGIWDIEGLRVDMGHSQGILQHQGVKGGSKSEFSLSGFIDSSTKVSCFGPPQITASKFIPMTPGTRRSVDPFNNQVSLPSKGQISVIEIPPPSSTRRTDEAILFRLGATYAVIPSILKYWTAHLGNEKSVSVFGSESGGRMFKFGDVGLQGELCVAATLIPVSKSSKETIVPEIVVLGEHRFNMISSAKSMAPSFMDKVAISHKSPINQDLISSEQMDISGIENIEMALEKMEERDGNEAKKNLFRF